MTYKLSSLSYALHLRTVMLRSFLVLFTFTFSLGSFAGGLKLGPQEASSSNLKNSRVLLMYGNRSDFPAEWQSYMTPGEVLDKPRDGRIRFETNLSNDNFLFGGGKVIARAFGYSKEEAKEMDGDDFGETYGFNITIGRDFNGKYFSLIYLSDLYTKRLPTRPDGIKPQHYNIHNFMGIFGEFPAEKLFINLENTQIKLGLGQEEVRGENLGGFFEAPKQQLFYHDVGKAIFQTQNQYEFTDRENSTHKSAFAQIALGTLRTLMNNGVYRLTLSGDVSLHITGLPKGSYGQLQSQFNLYRQTSASSKATLFSVGVDAKEYADNATKVSLDLSLRRGNELRFWEAKLSHFLIDEATETFVFDGDGDTQFEIRFGFNFGNPK